MPAEYVELVNAPQVERRLQGIAHRSANVSGGWRRAREILETNERRLFASYGGKYVQTGALRQSLTGGGSGAIRRPGEDMYEFGTSVWYAVFQGTRGEGRHQAPSAVLYATVGTRHRVGVAMLDYVVEGDE